MKKLMTVIILICSLLNASAKSITNNNEPKVDFLLRIYFSGENKDGLRVKMLVEMDSMRSMPYTDVLKKQYSFLENIQRKAEDAENACEVLEMLAVGIYELDAAEAKNQNVIFPSNKARSQTVDAVEGLSKIGNSANSVRNTAINVGLSSIIISGGKSTGLLSGAGKVAGAANTIGGVANTASQATATIKGVGGLIKSTGVFKKKDKPCSQVLAKPIAIGQHTPVAVPSPVSEQATSEGTGKAKIETQTSVITINGFVATSVFRAFSDSLKSKPGIVSVQKSFNEVNSSLTIEHENSTDVLADWIEDKFSNQFKVAGYSAGKITLALANKAKAFSKN